LPTVAIDLAQEDPDAGLFDGVDVVFHLAGIAHQRAAAAAYEALNHQATLRLARLAAAAGVRCFIFLSSVKAMGTTDGSAVRVESACVEPDDPYGLSKRKAELALQRAYSGHAMSVLIIRPALVYGEEPKGNLRTLAAAVRWHVPAPPARGSRSMIHRDDLVDLLCLLSLSPPRGLHTWIACGAQAYSTRQIYDLLRQASGRAPGTNWMPLWGWRLAARLLDIITRQAAGSTWQKLFGTERYSNAALVADTGWHPRRTLAEVVPAIAVHAGNHK
jgi:nucleoside-diphosphate-sugar epimerase